MELKINIYFGRNLRRNYQRSPQQNRSPKQYSLSSRKAQHQHFLTATSPFQQVLYPKTTNKEHQVIESMEVGCSKEHFLEEVRAIPVKLPQMVEILSLKIFSQIYKFIKTMLTLGNLESLPVAGRLRFFLENWKKMTIDPFILKIYQGYQILLLWKPLNFFPFAKSNETGGIDSCRSGNGKNVECKIGTFFLVAKKDTGHGPVISL